MNLVIPAWALIVYAVIGSLVGVYVFNVAHSEPGDYRRELIPCLCIGLGAAAIWPLALPMVYFRPRDR